MSTKKINLIIVERDDAMFDLLKQDIKQYSQYINRIYRCSYHEDVYSIHSWRTCRLIIANNPENAGLNFFKSFYLGDEAKRHKIHGLIYTSGHNDEIRFYRIARFLHEWSDRLFLGVIYKRFGGLEKILETIRHICCDFPPIPVFDWLHKETYRLVPNSPKLELLRKIHHLKYKIIANMQPLIFVLKQFNETKSIDDLHANIQRYKSHIKGLKTIRKTLYKHINDFLHLEFKGNRLDSASNHRSEISFFVKDIVKYFDEDRNHENSLANFMDLFSETPQIRDNMLNRIEAHAHDGSIELFLRECNNFKQSLEKLVKLLENDCLHDA